jgi:hypothetical protein
VLVITRPLIVIVPSVAKTEVVAPTADKVIVSKAKLSFFITKTFLNPLNFYRKNLCND